MSPHGHFPRKLLALVALLLLVPSGTALGSQTYADSPGDAPGGAPDITSVAISHKLAGDVTFKVAFANRSTVAGDDLVIVGIDSDQNRGTGYSDGIDWEIYVPGDTPTLGWIYRVGFRGHVRCRLGVLAEPGHDVDRQQGAGGNPIPPSTSV